MKPQVKQYSLWMTRFTTSFHQHFGMPYYDIAESFNGYYQFPEHLAEAFVYGFDPTKLGERFSNDYRDDTNRHRHLSPNGGTR